MNSRIKSSLAIGLQLQDDSRAAKILIEFKYSDLNRLGHVIWKKQRTLEILSPEFFVM